MRSPPPPAPRTGSAHKAGVVSGAAQSAPAALLDVTAERAVRHASIAAMTRRSTRPRCATRSDEMPHRGGGTRPPPPARDAPDRLRAAGSPRAAAGRADSAWHGPCWWRPVCIVPWCSGCYARAAPDDANIGAALRKVRGEAVPQRVHGHPAGPPAGGDGPVRGVPFALAVCGRVLHPRRRT